MRNIVNISLPPHMANLVEKEVRKGSYATKSEFFRSLLRTWEENKILSELTKSRKEIAEGKGKVLKSLKDLQ